MAELDHPVLVPSSSAIPGVPEEDDRDVSAAGDECDDNVGSVSVEVLAS
jgi:hypothetical protein